MWGFFLMALSQNAEEPQSAEVIQMRQQRNPDVLGSGTGIFSLFEQQGLKAQPQPSQDTASASHATSAVEQKQGNVEVY